MKKGYIVAIKDGMVHMSYFGLVDVRLFHGEQHVIEGMAKVEFLYETERGIYLLDRKCGWRKK